MVFFCFLKVGISSWPCYSCKVKGSFKQYADAIAFETMLAGQTDIECTSDDEDEVDDAEIEYLRQCINQI